MATALTTFRQAFTPLRIANLRIYLSGQAVSLIGTWLQSTAQSLVVYRLSGESATALGITAALNFLPSFFLAPFTGTIADRVDRRRLLFVTQFAAMIQAFIMAALVWSGLIQLWHVFVMALTLGVIVALDLPTQQAFLGDLSGMGEIRKTVNLNSMIINVSRFLGPALAGVIIARVGEAASFFLNGLSFIAVLWSLWAVRASRSAIARATSGGFGEALRFIRANPRIQDLLLFVVIMTFLGFPTLTVIPAVTLGNPETTGILLASSGLGSLTGVIFVVPFAQAAKRTGLVVAMAAAWLGAWLIVFALVEAFALRLASMYLSSMGAPVVMTMSMGLFQFLAPGQMRGRLISVNQMLSFGLQPLAALLIGISADYFGPTTAILINGTFVLIGVGLMLALRKGLRQWELPPLKPASPTPQPQPH